MGMRPFLGSLLLLTDKPYSFRIGRGQSVCLPCNIALHSKLNNRRASCQSLGARQRVGCGQGHNRLGRSRARASWCQNALWAVNAGV